ncbi:MAG: hypothetical protein EBZ50_04525 [Alphaproteobacteria bacterium]|nr:hypothetical protein [Alphaproteobacteria bacterium]
MPQIDPNLWGVVLLIATWVLARLDKRGDQQQGQGVSLAQLATRIDAIEGRSSFWNLRSDQVGPLETRVVALEQARDDHAETLKGWDRLVSEVQHMREAMDRLLTSVETLYQRAADMAPPTTPARGSRRKRAA